MWSKARVQELKIISSNSSWNKTKTFSNEDVILKQRKQKLQHQLHHQSLKDQVLKDTNI